MIVYYSGTGNSKYLAKSIANHLTDKLVDLNELIKSNNKSDINCDNENLIIVTPTYAWRMPKLVYDYLTSIKVNNAKNVYFIMSCGGEIGNAAKYNKQLAECLKLTYKGTIDVKMPDNYIIMFKPVSEEECIRLIKKINHKVNIIVAHIKENKDFKKPRNNLYDRFMSRFVNKQFYKYKISEKGFYVSNSCIGCGRCEAGCPLNNIKLIDKKPTWGNNCTHCMKCISYCPTNAINYKNKTEGKKPYRIEDYLKQIN